MITRQLIFTIIASPVLSQFVMDTGMRPDITFGEHNERFDVGAIVKEQKKMKDRYLYRRQLPKNGNLLEKLFEKPLRRYDGLDTAFAYHDDMNSDIGGDENQFEENLRNFKGQDQRRRKEFVSYLRKQIRRPARRNLDPVLEKEAWLQYSVPIKINVSGYLQVPLGT